MKHTVLETEYLKALLMACGPSSNEMAPSEIFRIHTGKKADKTIKDNMGNTIAIANPNVIYKVLLSAHIDEIGFQVSGVCSDGLLRIRKIGGVNTASLNGHAVVVKAKDGPVAGALVCKANGDNNVIPGIDEFFIDIDATSREEAERMVEMGDYVTFAPSVAITNDVITSKSIDNRIGVYIISEVFEHLSGKLKSIQLIAAATTQEEIGLKGMALIARETAPDICLNVDVTDALQIGKDELPAINKGVVVYKNADSNPLITKKLIESAERQDISHQVALGRNITGGTDASRIQLFSARTAVAELAIPCKYMHSQHEKCGVKDVLASINLISTFIFEMDKILSNGEQPCFIY